MNRNEIMLDIAQKIKKKRLALNHTQEAFALRSGVTLSTYRTFEKTAKGSFETFIAILSSLGAISQLEALLPKAPFSPAEIYKQTVKKERSRATKTFNRLPTAEKPSSKSSGLLKTIRAKNETK